MISGTGNNPSLNLNGTLDGQGKLRQIAPAASTSATAQQPARVSSGQEVQLSEQARNLLKLEQKLEQNSRTQAGQRDSRVTELRTLVQSGGYRVNSERIADKMIDIDEWFKPICKGRSALEKRCSAACVPNDMQWNCTIRHN